MESFDNFLSDMGKKPSPELSLERRDNNGDYEPDNCKWATRIEQNNNSRQNRRITIGDVTKTVAQWSRIVGINPITIIGRLNKRIHPLEAVFAPIRASGLTSISETLHRSISKVKHHEKIAMLDALREFKQTLGVTEPEGEPT